MSWCAPFYDQRFTHVQEFEGESASSVTSAEMQSRVLGEAWKEELLHGLAELMSAANPSAAPSTNVRLVQKLRRGFSGEELGVQFTAGELQRVLVETTTIPGKPSFPSVMLMSGPVTAKELLDRLENPACWDVGRA